MAETPYAGYVKLHRAILNHPLWTQLGPNVFKLAAYFVLRANYKPGKVYSMGKEIDVPMGTMLTTHARISEQTGLSISQIRTAIGHLENLHFLTRKLAGIETLITITNYETYQSSEIDDRRDVDNVLATLSQHVRNTSYKEGKKERREEDSRARGTIPEQPAPIRARGEASSPNGARPAAKAPAPDIETVIAELQALPAYTGLDVRHEYDKCFAWTTTRGRKVTKRGLVNWLNRCDVPLNGKSPGRAPTGDNLSPSEKRNAEFLKIQQEKGRVPR